MRPKRFSWIEEVLEAGAREARFEIVGEARVLLAEVVEKGGSEVAEVEVIKGKANGRAEVLADETG